MHKAFDVLQMDYTSISQVTHKSLRTQFHKLSLLHHPDKTKSSDPSKFQEINEAYTYAQTNLYLFNPSINSHESNFVNDDEDYPEFPRSKPRIWGRGLGLFGLAGEILPDWIVCLFFRGRRHALCMGPADAVRDGGASEFRWAPGQIPFGQIMSDLRGGPRWIIVRHLGTTITRDSGKIFWGRGD